MNLEDRAKEFKGKIFEGMLETRGKKFKTFLTFLKAFKYISLSPTRGEFLQSYYALMRYIDDVVDGDLVLPGNYSDKPEFVLSKMEFALFPNNPKDDVDNLLLYCLRLGEKFGADFQSETSDILSSMLFDAKRYGTREVFPSDELSYHFNLLDIKGTASATLKVFREDPTKYALLIPLALANRTFMNLRDFEDDLNSGFVNISKEDMLEYGINPETLIDRNSQNVSAWFIDQSRRGLELLRQHRSNVEGENFGLLTRCTMPLVYGNPSKQYFEKVLRGQT